MGLNVDFAGMGGYNNSGPVYAMGNRTAVADAAYTVKITDYLVVYTSLTAGRAITGPAAPVPVGWTFVLKDETGSANTYNLTFTPASGNIDGAGTKVINTAYGLFKAYFNGTNWFTIY